MPSTSYTGYEELSELSEEELRRCTKASLPLFIPWHPKQTIPLGTFFFSSRSTDPWATNSPFSTKSLALTPILVERDYGSQSVFKSISTSRSTETNDHLELGLGVGAGLPFLASVTVKGSYCKDVQENNDVSHQTHLEDQGTKVRHRKTRLRSTSAQEPVPYPLPNSQN